MGRVQELESEWLACQLVSAGFVPDVPLYWAYGFGDNNTPTLAAYKVALFERTYSKPCGVDLWVGERTFVVVPELIQAIYSPRLHGDIIDHEVPIGYWDEPNWYVRGYLMRGAPWYNVPDFTVHLYFEKTDPERVLAQLAPAVRGDVQGAARLCIKDGPLGQSD